ncbi:hypothetical protein C2E23DRAFT_167224 [Lenzites betulinus]|nr:hypothetical protein C2E23DRAFT_167224 [Lenzites betulinus]
MNYYPYDQEESRSLVGAAAPIPLAPLASMPYPTLGHDPNPHALPVNSYFSQDMYKSPPQRDSQHESFVPIKAKFKVDDGEIVSRDPHLNKDGDALYRFIMTHAQERPEMLLHVKGSHVETANVKYSVPQADGGKPKDTQTQFSATVSDFNFYIDVGRHICHGPIHWTVPDEVPEYRGKLYPEVDRPRDDHDPEHGVVHTKRKKASGKDVDATAAWTEFRWLNGLPPWVGPNDRDAQSSNEVRLLPRSAAVLQSSRSIRDWAYDYCKSKRKLKEFVYEKTVYGWDVGKLENAVAQIIRDSGYPGDWTVEFILRKNTIRVRPDTALSRALAHTWVKVLLWLFLIYPFVWFYKRYDEHGGGKWEVCGGAWALKYWEPDPTGVIPGMDDANGRIVPTMGGAVRMMGLREGEWFQQWQGTIGGRMAGGYCSDEPLTTPDPAPVDPVATLDGYK